MSDLERGDLGGPANEAFRAAMQAAEEAALAAEAPDAVEDPTPVVEETSAPVAEETPAVETVDERDARIARLEAQLAAKDEFIGRQSSEIGDLRQTVEERLSQLDQRVNTPIRQITPDLIETNPAAATQMAFEQGDTYTLQAAFETWKMEDPTGAAVWAATKQAEEREKAIRSDYDRRLSEIESQYKPIAARSQEQELQQAVASLPEDTKTFLADAATVEALATEFPTLGRTIASGAPAERIEAVRALYDIHRGRVSDTLSRTVQDAARSTAEEAQAIRDEAYVASTTASQEQPKTFEQIEQEKAIAAFSRKQTSWESAFVKPGKQ